MKVTICSSSVENIDNKYKESAQELLDYLVTIDNIELIWGAGDTSLMGMCYDTFVNANRLVHGYTTRKYEDMISNLDKADIKVVDTTFDLKKGIFYDADTIIYLYGGIGSISEFFAHLEEVRSNYDNKELIIYDTEGYYDKVLELLDYSIKEQFTKENVLNMFKVVHSIEELKEIIKGE